MWRRWLASYPDLELLETDVGRGLEEHRRLHAPSWPALLLLRSDERSLYHCLRELESGDWGAASRIAWREAESHALLSDLHLLAGAFYLGDGRCSEAIAPLERCTLSGETAGAAMRRLYPGLRILLRISPCLLMPLYPSPYAAALLHGVALWHGGQTAEALRVLRAMAGRWGLYDEIKLVLGQIHLQRGEYDLALEALSAQDTVERDALELARCFYIAYTHYLREEYRSAAKVLSPALKTLRTANPLLAARARLLLAECCERNGLLLDALRESAQVAVDEVPGSVAAVMLEREERWVTALGLLDAVEIERLARADNYQMYLPEAAEAVVQEHSRLDTTRDPLKKLTPRETSWLKRQAEERRYAAAVAQVARGETVSTRHAARVSSLGRETQGSIAAAQRWWPSRREELCSAAPRERLALPGAQDVGHVRCDYCGARETDSYTFTGERRATGLAVVVAVSLVLALFMLSLRGCIYGATW